MRFLPKPLACGPELLAEFAKISAAEVSHLNTLDMAPNPLFGIKLGSISWKPLQVDTSSCSLTQELLDQLASVNHGPIPDNEQFARNVAQQMFEEGDHFRALDCMFVGLEVELAPK